MVTSGTAALLCPSNASLEMQQAQGNGEAKGEDVLLFIHASVLVGASKEVSFHVLTQDLHPLSDHFSLPGAQSTSLSSLYHCRRQDRKDTLDSTYSKGHSNQEDLGSQDEKVKLSLKQSWQYETKIGVSLQNVPSEDVLMPSKSLKAWKPPVLQM